MKFTTNNHPEQHTSFYLSKKKPNGIFGLLSSKCVTCRFASWWIQKNT